MVPERLLNYFDQHDLSARHRKRMEMCYIALYQDMWFSEQEALEILNVDSSLQIPYHRIYHYRVEILEQILDRVLEISYGFFALPNSRVVLKLACIDGVQDWFLETLKNYALDGDKIIENAKTVIEIWETSGKVFGVDS